MNELWARTLVPLLAGCSGVAATVLSRSRLQPWPRAEPSPQPSPEPEPAAATAGPDAWSRRLHRCEQSVGRAERAIDTISSDRTKQRLRLVVRRMEAELPTVSALAELGRGLEAGPAADRVSERLDDAVRRFAEFTGQALEAVAELVADPEPELVDRRVAALRAEFPLTSPFSTVLAPAPSQG